MNLSKAVLIFVSPLLVVGSALAGPKVEFDTSKGKIVVELNEEKAPKTVANFLKYVDDGHYDGIVFHRVIEDFMIQTGGFAVNEGGKIEQKEVRDPIQNEAKNGLKNEFGSLAMARTGDPHSASAQFFINLKDNSFLDYPGQDGWGYAVFGKVVEGIDVVEAIGAVSTGQKMISARGYDGSLSERPFRDVPSEDVVIKTAKRLPAE
ncbi:MAG: peptidylprolyl isomerase [Verrucomicrobiota bacterium]